MHITPYVLTHDIHIINIARCFLINILVGDDHFSYIYCDRFINNNIKFTQNSFRKER